MKYSNDFTDDYIISSFGKQIKEYRVSINITQSDFASKCGVSLSTLERVENGSDTKLSNIVKIMRAFNLIENIGLLIPDAKVNLKSYYENNPKRKRASKINSSDNAKWIWEEDKKKGE